MFRGKAELLLMWVALGCRLVRSCALQDYTGMFVRPEDLLFMDGNITRQDQLLCAQIVPTPKHCSVDGDSRESRSLITSFRNHDRHDLYKVVSYLRLCDAQNLKVHESRAKDRLLLMPLTSVL